MKECMKEKRGFTLIELLVVIAIIGILSSVVLASLQTARAKSRDAKRISDLRQVQLALELYYDVNRAYPSAITTATLVTPGYIPSIPTDPTTGVSYKYSVRNATCTSYHLGADLEQTSNIALNNDSDATAVAATSATCPDASVTTSDFSGGFPTCSATSGTPDGCYDLTP